MAAVSSRSGPFDEDIQDAYASDALAKLFRSAFDKAAVPGVLGFSFVPMAGLGRVVELLGPDRPGTVLDAGCGWGGPGLWIAQALGCALTGVDSSAVGVELARERALDTRTEATFTVGSLEQTKLESGSVDAVISIDALHFAGDPHAAAEELIRVVRPGGALVATLWRTDGGPERFVRDHSAILAEAGWSVLAEEDHPEWLQAQIALYDAALAIEASATDAAVRRLQREGSRVAPIISEGRRLLIHARRPAQLVV